MSTEHSQIRPPTVHFKPRRFSCNSNGLFNLEVLKLGPTSFVA